MSVHALTKECKFGRHSSRLPESVGVDFPKGKDELEMNGGNYAGEMNDRRIRTSKIMNFAGNIAKWPSVLQENIVFGINLE